MWFDPSPGRTDASPLDARGVAVAAALFSCGLVVLALNPLDTVAKLAAAAFHLS